MWGKYNTKDVGTPGLRARTRAASTLDPPKNATMFHCDAQGSCGKISHKDETQTQAECCSCCNVHVLIPFGKQPEPHQQLMAGAVPSRPEQEKFYCKRRPRIGTLNRQSCLLETLNLKFWKSSRSPQTLKTNHIPKFYIMSFNPRSVKPDNLNRAPGSSEL